MPSLSLFSLRNSIEAFSFYIVSFYIVPFYIDSINYPDNHSFVFLKVGQLRKQNSAN